MPDPRIALLIGVFIVGFILLLFFPQGGLFGRWLRLRQLSTRVLVEDALKHIYKTEAEGHPATLQSVAGALQRNSNKIAELVEIIEREGYVTTVHGEVRLSAAGRSYALHVIRAHRLWEHYLAEETGFEEVEWHSRAHEFEHAMSKEQLDALATRLGNPVFDPHGDPIPTAEGEMIALGGKPLTDVDLGIPVRIVHLENEPQAVFAQLIAEGLYPGLEVRVIEATPTRITFWANGEEHRLAPIVAANVEVLPLANHASSKEEDQVSENMAYMKIGQKAKIVSISPRMRGAERRRFMDLGVLPGTLVAAEMVSPSGETTAYRIRGALIALRKEQAQAIKIALLQETPA